MKHKMRVCQNRHILFFSIYIVRMGSRSCYAAFNTKSIANVLMIPHLTSICSFWALETGL